MSTRSGAFGFLPKQLGRLRFGAAFAALAMLALVAVSTPAQSQTYSFSSFTVEGNQRISAADVLTLTGIAPGSRVSAGQVNDALQRLQNTGFFESVEIAPRGGRLVITVQEFPTINRISIEGNQRLSDEDLLPLLESTPRRIYSPATAERDAETLANAYTGSGRLTATVRPRIIPRGDDRVDLVFEVAEGRVVETESIAFVGNRDFSDRRLRRVLESTQAGLFRLIIRRDTFLADRIALDRQLLTDFYLDRGYVDFQILSVTPELTRNRDAYFVTFNIREGQSFTIGAMTTVSEIPGVNAADYQATLRLRPGQTYSPRVVDNAISRMENLATQRGLRFVRVEPVITRNDATRTLDIQFVISRGERVFVERIDIEGNASTLDRVIRRQFDSVEGDPFDPRAIRAASERIRATGYFANVEVDARPGSTDDQVIVDVDVEEQPTGSLGFSGNFSTDNGFGLAITFAESNFLGRGQRLNVGFNTTEGSQSYTFRFSEPAFLRRNLALGLSAFYIETNNQNRDFDTLDYGIGVSLGFPISEFGRMSLSYGLEQNNVSDVSADSSPIIQADEGDRLSSFIGIGYTFDTRNRGLDPNMGILLDLDLRYAGLGGDAEYVSATMLAQAERRIMREEVTLRASFEAGALETISGNSRISDRFFFNSRQMRGFEPFGLGPRDLAAPNRDALGGNYFAVARFEAAFPLGLPDEYGISGGVFADVGSVWGLQNTTGFGGATVDDSIFWRSTVGVSLFWETAIGPLRFNFSQPVRSRAGDLTRTFDLTIEARF